MVTKAIQQKLSDSKSARWSALVIVSVTMMFGYFFTDVMSPLEPLLTAAKENGGLGLGWSSDEYGFFSGAYGYFNVFLFLLFLGGIILDKFGIRFTGIMSTVLMFTGALIKWYAVSHNFEGSIAVPFFWYIPHTSCFSSHRICHLWCRMRNSRYYCQQSYCQMVYWPRTGFGHGPASSSCTYWYCWSFSLCSALC